MTGWWYTYPSEKYEFVSWDDDIPNIWKNNPNVPNHQPDDIVMLYILLRIIFTNQNCWRHQETRQHWHGRHSLQWSAPQLKPNGSFFMGSYCRAREIQIDRLKTVVNIPFFFGFHCFNHPFGGLSDFAPSTVDSWSFGDPMMAMNGTCRLPHPKGIP